MFSTPLAGPAAKLAALLPAAPAAAPIIGATYTQIGLRDDLSDLIYSISPEETPFMSAIGRGRVAEWQKDRLV